VASFFGELHDDQTTVASYQKQNTTTMVITARQLEATQRRSSCLPVGGRRPATEQHLKTEKPAAADHMLQRCRRQKRGLPREAVLFRCRWPDVSFRDRIAVYLSAVCAEHIIEFVALTAVTRCQETCLRLDTSSPQLHHCIHKERWTINEASLLLSAVANYMKRGFSCSNHCVTSPAGPQITLLRPCLRWVKNIRQKTQQ
jgi:hypothetical protein